MRRPGDKHAVAEIAYAVKMGKKKLADLPPSIRGTVRNMSNMDEGDLKDFAKAKAAPASHLNESSRGATLRNASR